MVEKKAHILIVDDERTLCETMAEVLRDEGYQTEVAFDGPEAIEKIKNTKFDVIFCRNVLIYFDRSSKQRVVGFIEKKLNAGGFLFVSMTESLNDIQTNLHYWQTGAYQKE